VATSYGWGDLTDLLSDGNHVTDRIGDRWTVQPEAQREIERRLLALNLERAAAGAGPTAENADADLATAE